MAINIGDYYKKAFEKKDWTKGDLKKAVDFICEKYNHG